MDDLDKVTRVLAELWERGDRRLSGEQLKRLRDELEALARQPFFGKHG